MPNVCVHLLNRPFVYLHRVSFYVSLEWYYLSIRTTHTKLCWWRKFRTMKRLQSPDNSMILSQITSNKRRRPNIATAFRQYMNEFSLLCKDPHYSGWYFTMKFSFHNLLKLLQNETNRIEYHSWHFLFVSAWGYFLYVKNGSDGLNQVQFVKIGERKRKDRTNTQTYYRLYCSRK